jgi:hypothetical protein
VFIGCVIGAGLRSVALGKDANWDLRNYHWYNAWALLNGRLGFDLAPAQLQTYHNPLADLPFYALARAFQDEPRVVAFAMGLYTAVAAFFLLRLLALLFPFDRERANVAFWLGAAALVGLTGAMGTATWGTTMNEWPSAALAMAALWLAARAGVEGELLHRRAFAAAGLLMGLAAGTKLTYCAFALGLGAAALAYGSAGERIRRAALFGAFAAIGFLLAYGWWGWTLWREFANPFFPYFNATFRSPWWEAVDFYDTAQGPRTWRHWVFFPIYFAQRSLLVSQVAFRDYRLATLMVVGVAAFLVSRYRNLRGSHGAAPAGPAHAASAWRMLAVFTLVSYVAWLKLFAQYRYLVPLDLLSGALIVACLTYMFGRGRLALAIVGVLAALLVGTTRPGSWGRVPFGERYFDVAAPEIAPGSLVIVGYAHPMAYAAPFFRPDARWVSPQNNFIGLGQENLLAKRAAGLIGSHRGPLYLLEFKSRNGHDRRMLEHFGLASDEGACVAVPSSFDDNQMRICRLERERS